MSSRILLTRPRLTRRLVLLWMLLGFVLWVVVVVVTLLAASSDLRAARAGALSLADEATQTADPRWGELLAEIPAIDAHLQAADRDMDRFYLEPVKWLPVIGRQVRVADQVAETLASISNSAIAALDLVTDGPEDRLELLEAAEREIAVLRAAVEGRDLGPDQNLFAGLADQRAELDLLLDDLEPELVKVQAVVVAVRRLLEGGDYLLLGANNAEMLAGSGMVLSVGLLDIEDGDLSLGEFGPSDERFPVPTRPPSGPTAIDPDVDARWGYMLPTNDYRKMTLTARFAEFGAPQALLMWEAQTGRRAEGAMLLDPFVLDALLGVVGPVEVDGETYAQGMALDYLLKGQYAEFAATSAGRDARRDQLSIIAAAVLERVQAAEFDPLDLVDAMRPMIAGRHLMLYSTNAAEQAGWEALGLAGEITGSETGVFAMNLGGSKLDPYVEVDVEVSVTQDVADGPRTVRYTTTLTHTVSDAASLPDYVVGPWDSIPLAERGTYSGRLLVNVPGTASDLRFVPQRRLEVYGTDGPLFVMGSRVQLLPGQSETIVIEYQLPTAVTAVDVIPSARFPSTTWTFGPSVVEDVEAFELSLAD